MEETPSAWEVLIQRRISRRRLLQGAATTGIAAATTGLTPARFAIQPAQAAPEVPFEPIAATKQDDLVLPRGFTYDVVARWGDVINSSGDTFGFNCDYTAFFPLPTQGRVTEGILAVNHEYIDVNFVGKHKSTPKPLTQVLAEMYNVGMSFIHIRQVGKGPWELVQDDFYNRRLTGNTFPIKLTGPASGSPNVGGNVWVAGTLGNCSGCHTPWNTVLTCEENYHDYYGEHSLVTDMRENTNAAQRRGTYRWHDQVPYNPPAPFAPAANTVIRPEHYGWVVEVDPYNPHEPPRKHTALGRFRHENVAIAFEPNRPVVAYMGDDRRPGYVYKFISAKRYKPGAQHREYNKTLLETGTLYVAKFEPTVAPNGGPANYAHDTGTGQWTPLPDAVTDDVTDPITGLPFTAASILVHAFNAAAAVGGTLTDRPEDIEIHPRDGSVFIAFTNNVTTSKPARDVKHGYVVQLVETNGDPLALTFTWDVFAFGGPDPDGNHDGGGFSSPDNMVFDDQANLWLVTDISSSSIAATSANPNFAPHGNNGVFFSPTKGKNRGKCYQFASVPPEAEATGPTWSPDGRTLFLAIQHPGEDASEKGLPFSSQWPDYDGNGPRPSVVAIRGFK